MANPSSSLVRDWKFSKAEVPNPLDRGPVRDDEIALDADAADLHHGWGQDASRAKVFPLRKDLQRGQTGVSSDPVFIL